eukprot:scaffold115564_cov13-Prasinocladus_malaysianus.AAC.1
MSQIGHCEFSSAVELAAVSAVRAGRRRAAGVVSMHRCVASMHRCYLNHQLHLLLTQRQN